MWKETEASRFRIAHFTSAGEWPISNIFTRPEGWIPFTEDELGPAPIERPGGRPSIVWSSSWDRQRRYPDDDDYWDHDDRTDHEMFLDY